MIQIGNLNLVSSTLELERRVFVLEKTIEHILSTNPSIKGFTKSDIDRFNNEAIATLQKKYPDLVSSPNN